MESKLTFIDIVLYGDIYIYIYIISIGCHNNLYIRNVNIDIHIIT